ncbi:MAG: ABC transporter substrate-binding protein [Pseudomonadota bacterium]
MSISKEKIFRPFMQGILLCLVLLTTTAHAMKAPDQVVKDTVDRIVENIQSNREAYRADNKKLFAMVEEVLVPSLHVPRMSSLILGKAAKNASPAQKKAFADEFKTFLMRSYATALLEYTGSEKVNYEPVTLNPGDDKVLVKATLVASDGQTYPVNLYMSNRRDTQWRAYNMEVAEINFVSTYRSSFGGIIAKKGVDGLIAELRTKNSKTAPKS